MIYIYRERAIERKNYRTIHSLNYKKKSIKLQWSSLNRHTTKIQDLKSTTSSNSIETILSKISYCKGFFRSNKMISNKSVQSTQYNYSLNIKLSREDIVLLVSAIIPWTLVHNQGAETEKNGIVTLNL